MRHKHYDCIVAWAEGKKIEFFDVTGEWVEIVNPQFDERIKYRIKKEPVIIEEHYKKDSYGRFIWVNSPEGYDLKITYQDGKAIKAEVAE